MARDALVYGWIVVSFALLVTAHLALAIGLSRQWPRWRGPLSLVIVPLAPYWGYTSGLRGRAIAWGVGFASYASSIAAATFG